MTEIPSIAARLHEKTALLFFLNPDLPIQEIKALFDTAALAESEHFDVFAEVADKLTEAYLNMPLKSATRSLLREYFDHLERSQRLLAASGEITVPGKPGTAENRQSMALVPVTITNSLEWCKVINRAEMSRDLMVAVEACRRRHEAVTSVVEIMTRVLVRLDRHRAYDWMLGYLDRHDGDLDSDIVRDFLLVWNDETDPLSPAVLEWALEWSGDEALQRQWPRVVSLSDRLLRRQVLIRLAAGEPPRHGRLARLRYLALHHLGQEVELRRWFEETLGEFGRGIEFFGKVSSGQENGKDWRPLALYEEIRNAEQLFPVLLELADVEYDRPAGPLNLSLGFFGLIGEGRQSWDQALEKMSIKAVKRLLLQNLQKNRSPEELIEIYTFGDIQVRERLLQQLDVGTRHFTDLDQQEQVVKVLACYYASFREPYLLATEISSRYRNLMRMLHEDNLHRLLDAATCRQVLASPVIAELTAMAGDIRKYLSMRRALDHTVEEMAAAEMEFIALVRRRRLAFLCRDLGISPRLRQPGQPATG